MSLCGLKFEKLIRSNPALQKELASDSLRDSPKFDRQVNELEYASKIGFGYNAAGTLDAAVSADESSTGELGRNEELDY